MKILVPGGVLTLAAAVALLPSGATAATNSVSKPAGFVRLVVPPAASRFAAMPLVAADPGIAGIFSNQLTGATNEAAADRIQKWAPSGQQYTDAYKYGDGAWYADFTSFATSDLSFHPGEGFLIHNRQAVTQTVILCGSVVLDGASTQNLANGLTFIGYPFSTARRLNDTGIAASGAQAAADWTNADQVWMWDSGLGDYRAYGLKDSDNLWHAATNWTGLATDDYLPLGQGQWFHRAPTNGLEWSEDRPYEHLYPANGDPPVITGLRANAQQDEITLCIDANGIGTLEIYYKDLDATDAFESTGWRIAATNVTGGGSVVWTDDGSGGRGKVDTVYARYYLVGNAGMDSDGDGLPDSRETFVHGTLADNPDTDGDGVQDGAEVARGTSPTNAGSLNVTVYSDGTQGSDAYDGYAAAWDGAHGPKQTLGAAIHDAAIGGDTIEVAAGAYAAEPQAYALGNKSLILRPKGIVTIE